MQARDEFVAERGRQIQAMPDRARTRGEHPLESLDVLDHILAPMHIRVLFGAGPLNSQYTDALVDRLLHIARPGATSADR